ncbi:MAG: outer membrane beta-barrel protein [Bacteroidales bacterium]|nr:outer membrane beta-barrel protein [Bacteroidales bacterium]
MKKLLCISILLFLIYPLYSQRNANVGIFAGTSYYMGDINPSRHFYRLRPSLGMIYRINLNNHYAIRANVYYAYVSGSDMDFAERINPDRYYEPVEFNTSILDGALQFEFNFLPFIPNEGRWNYTTYVSGGIGYSLVISSAVSTNLDTDNLRNPIPHLNIPFGIGFKLNINRRVSAGCEWNFRKTFSDRIDFLKNPTGDVSLIHNNDWYSFAGIFVTYKFINFAVDCPAYD